MKLFGGSGNRNTRQNPDPRKKRGSGEDDLILTPGDAENAEDAFARGGGEPEEYARLPAGTMPDAEDVILDSAGMKRRRIRKIIIAAAVVAVLVTSGVAVYKNWSKPPDVNPNGPATPNAGVTKPPDPNNTEGPVSVTDDPNDPRKKGCYTFLIVGIDKMSTSTDTMIVGRLDTANHTLSCISIPRDTLVNVSWGTKKVNTLYSADINSGGDGVEGLKKGIKDLIGFEVDSYAVIDLTAFEKLVDAIGGVTYVVPVDMYYSAPDQNLYINIPKGEQHLNGEDALKVVRFRSGYADADIGRIHTQQDFLMTVAKQMLTLGNIPNLPKFIEIYGEYVNTDLSTGNLAFYIEEFLKIKSDDISFQTVPANYNGSIKGGSYCFINIDEWLEMINESLNPWKIDITEANLNVLTKTSSGFYSTTGVIAGGENSFFDFNAYLASLGQ